MTSIVEVENLTKVFAGRVTAVDDVSLRVGEGEFVTLLGPSGCGKTTILRIIAGFESPDRGRVLLGGRDVTDDPPYKRAVNTVFQDYALFPHMTVAQNVGYGLRIAGIRRAEIGRQVEDALRMVELLDKIDSRPAELSGGQRQRVALARAIIRRPKVLLLDEPLSALDVKLREAMQVELKHLHQRLGISFILVTHDQKEALVMSDRVVVIDRGRIVQCGSPAELYDRPATPYVASFVGTSNLVPAVVVAASDADGVVAEVGGARLRARSGAGRFAPGARVLIAIRPEKVVTVPAGGAVPDAFNRIEARVIEHLFHGHGLRTEFDIGCGAPFMVDVQLPAALAEVGLAAPGAAVTLAVDPANLTVFPAEGPP